jgi:hypothetical protein
VRLKIESARASWSGGKFHVAFGVTPMDLAHIDLKTGEIFQGADRARLRKQEDKLIKATLFPLINHPTRACTRHCFSAGFV